MAMSIPKSGYARFMKEGAMHFKGMDEAVKRNIEACVELSNQVRTAYGPNGMNKMIINRIEKLFVTNDAVTILNELEVQHPAAKTLILAAQMQEKQIGDSTNTVIIFAAALLEHAVQLLDMGLTAVEIASGYELAFEKTAEILPKLVVAKAEDLHDLSKVGNYLKASIMSKQFEAYKFVAELVAKACVQTMPKSSSSFNVDNIRVVKIIGGGIHNSTVVNGMVFRRGAEGEVKSASNARVAIFACPFDLTQTETKGTILMNNADDLLQFSTTEESEVESQVKGLHDAGVNVVVAAGKFGDLYLHFLNKYGIMGVRLTSKFDLRRLCRTIGAQAQARICAPTVDLLGQCDEVYLEEIGDTQVVIFNKKSESGHVATVVIRGSSQSLMDDIERAIDDAVNTYKALTRDNQLLAGAGAVEIELARQIESIGEKYEGLQQYSIKQFALALETLPKQLAENAGLKPTETISSLYAAHSEGRATDGIDVESGSIVNSKEKNIFDVYSGKLLALKLATNAAATILKIDQKRLASTLVIAEHNDEKLNPLTLNAITAAKKLGGDISVFVAGSNAEKVAKESSKIPDVKTIIFAQDAKLENQLTERVSEVLLAVQKKFNFSHIVGGASAFSRGVLPRFASQLNVSPLSEVTEIHDESTFSRPIYAGNAITKVKSNDATKCFTIRTSAFEASSAEGGNAAIEKAPDTTISEQSEFIGQELSKSERPELGAAKIVISGGRGLKSGDNFKILYELADELGAAVGASRAAVDAGFVPNDMQVGQTGKIVAPELYIAVGISGAIQHLAGMKDSKVIVAINTDKDAPIFQVADFGLAQDLFKAVPELTGEIRKQRKN